MDSSCPSGQEHRRLPKDVEASGGDLDESTARCAISRPWVAYGGFEAIVDLQQ